MSARICVSILPKSISEAIKLVEKAEKAEADLVEVRLDCLDESKNLQDLAKATKLPLIATNKLQSEKGYFLGNETQRRQTLFNAAKNGFEYVDVDFFSSKRDETVSLLKALGTTPIVSYHKYDGPLSVFALEKILDEEINSGAGVCKIVLTANQIEDNLPILSFVSFASTKAKVVCFCMGEHGKISRVLSPLFGAFFTFASLEKGSETAGGQMTIKEIKNAYGLLGQNK